jgi:hypothetical protein
MEKHFIANADSETEMEPGPERKKAEMIFEKYGVVFGVSRAKFLEENAFEKGNYKDLVMAILMADPASLPDVHKLH